jgi:hypothetical protein
MTAAWEQAAGHNRHWIRKAASISKFEIARNFLTRRPGAGLTKSVLDSESRRAYPNPSAAALVQLRSCGLVRSRLQHWKGGTDTATNPGMFDIH